MKHGACAECGERMLIDDDGVSFHVGEDGEVLFDQDQDHVAVDEDEYGL